MPYTIHCAYIVHGIFESVEYHATVYCTHNHHDQVKEVFNFSFPAFLCNLFCSSSKWFVSLSMHLVFGGILIRWHQQVIELFWYPSLRPRMREWRMNQRHSINYVEELDNVWGCQNRGHMLKTSYCSCQFFGFPQHWACFNCQRHQDPIQRLVPTCICMDKILLVDGFSPYWDSPSYSMIISYSMYLLTSHLIV